VARLRRGLARLGLRRLRRPALQLRRAGRGTALLLVGWATGGIVFGWLTDRIGRARTLGVTVVVYATATAACALAPDLWTLVALRAVASLGIGGEWAAGAALVAEVVPERHRVALGALLYTASPIGIFVAAWVTDLLTHRVDALVAAPDLAWRLVFLTGLVPAAFAIWVRRRVEEPPAWAAVGDAHPRLRELFAPGLRDATVGGLVLCVVTLIAWWGTNAFLPFVVAHVVGAGADPAAVADARSRATALFTLGGLVGALGTIPLARLGRRALFACYFAGSAAAIWATFGLDWPPATRLALLFTTGVTVFGVNAAFGFYLPELFPVRLRGTGAGFCYNTGRYLAAAGPLVVGRVLAAAPTPMDAIKWVAVVPLVGLACVPLARETALTPSRCARSAAGASPGTTRPPP
jgi:MFS family permease